MTLGDAHTALYTLKYHLPWISALTSLLVTWLLPILSLPDPAAKKIHLKSKSTCHFPARNLQGHPI